MTRILAPAILTTLILTAAAAALFYPPPQSTTEVVVIEMTAKKYDFEPAEVRVKLGTKVQLKISATDRDHGIVISPRPEGAKDTDPPGLEFPSGKNSIRLEKDQPQVLEFTALRPGAYPFKCSVRCGLGHGKMKGRIVVEP